MIKSIKLAMCILFSMTMLESAWANQSLVLSHNLILFACQTKTGEKINLKSLRQADRYILSFHAGKYAATALADSTYFAYTHNSEVLSFESGKYIYEVAQFHDGDAGVTITSSQTGKEIQQYKCWDEMNMRLNRVSPHYFKPYTDEWESRLRRRFLK